MAETLMRRVSKILFQLLAYRPPTITVPTQGAILADVNLVTPGAERRAHQTVVIQGDTIARIVPYTGEQTSDQPYAGSYVLPGLIDMHVHLPPPTRNLAGLLFLAHGITTVRETGDADGTTWQARERIQRGDVPGPRIFACGPVLDGDPPFLPTSWRIRTAAEARAAVCTLAAQGADFIKVQHMLSPEALAAIREAAAENGLPVAGHIPIAVAFANAHINDVQHLDGLVPYPQSPETPLDYQKKWRDLSPEAIEHYVQISVDQKRSHTPTLVTWTSLLQMRDPHSWDDPALRLLPRFYRDGAWNRETMPLFNRFSDEALTIMKQGLSHAQEVVRRLYQAGVPLHLGTDSPGMPFLVPGLSLQQELGLFVEAGLPLEAAWAAGTGVAGQSLGIPRLGTIQPGAPADLLLFAEDPTRDLAALSTLKAVIAQGRLYSKSFLDEALARHRDCFEKLIYDRLSTAFIRQMTRMMMSRN